MGCTSSRGQVYAAMSWAAPAYELGRVVLAPPATPEDLKPEFKEEIREIAREVLTHLPATTLVDNGAFLERIGVDGESRPISDYEAVMAARDLDIDTVCLLTVGHYRGLLMVTLIPPAWHTRTTALYGLRLIDVESGKLILHTVRLRYSGGYFAVLTHSDLADDFREDLLSVLSPPGT